MGRRVLRRLFDVVLVASVLVLVALGVGPRLGRYRTLNVLSPSMRPGMPAGSLVIVTPESPASVRPGQVITYTVPEETPEVVTHRVIERYGPPDAPVVRTRGDANAAPDPWLTHLHGTVWRVRFVIPHAGLVVETIRHAGWRPLVVDLLPFVVALMWISEIWRRPRPGLAVPQTATLVDDDDCDGPNPIVVTTGSSWYDDPDNAAVVQTATALVDIPAGVVTAVMCEDDGSVFIAVISAPIGAAVTVTVAAGASSVPAAHIAHVDAAGGLRAVERATPYELLSDPWIGQNIDDRLAANLLHPAVLRHRSLAGVS